MKIIFYYFIIMDPSKAIQPVHLWLQSLNVCLFMREKNSVPLCTSQRLNQENKRPTVLFFFSHQVAYTDKTRGLFVCQSDSYLAFVSTQCTCIIGNLPHKNQKTKPTKCVAQGLQSVSSVAPCRQLLGLSFVTGWSPFFPLFPSTGIPYPPACFKPR